MLSASDHCRFPPKFISLVHPSDAPSQLSQCASQAFMGDQFYEGVSFWLVDAFLDGETFVSLKSICY